MKRTAAAEAGTDCIAMKCSGEEWQEAARHRQGHEQRGGTEKRQIEAKRGAEALQSIFTPAGKGK